MHGSVDAPAVVGAGGLERVTCCPRPWTTAGRRSYSASRRRNGRRRGATAGGRRPARGATVRRDDRVGDPAGLTAGPIASPPRRGRRTSVHRRLPVHAAEARAASAPHAFPIARARSIPSPASHDARNPASNASPEPVVSTTSLRARAATLVIRSPSAATAPSAPAFATTTAPTREREDRALQLLLSGDQPRLGGVGEEHVGLREDVAQPAVPRLRRVPVGVERRRPAAARPHPEQRREVLGEPWLEEEGADVDVPRGVEQLRIDRSAVRSPIVPAWVRIARSSRPASTTVTPVGRSGSVTSPRTSTPRATSSSRMNRPNGRRRPRRRTPRAGRASRRRRRRSRPTRRRSGERRPRAVPPARTRGERRPSGSGRGSRRRARAGRVGRSRADDRRFGRRAAAVRARV